MNYKHTVEAAIANLNEIEDLLQGIMEQETVPAIEIDLVMQKARNLYEVLLLLKATAGNKALSSQEQGLLPNKNEIRTEKLSDDDTSVVPREKLSGEKTGKKAAVRQSGSLPDAKKKNIDVLQESLAGQHLLHENFHQEIKYQDLSSRLQTKPITNLSAAIGINERFLYIRELFNNDTKKYENALEILNNAASFNDAYNFMIREFTWDMDGEIVQSLLDLIRRKFITSPHE